MTVAYFDTSALVKLFIDETGSKDAAALWDGADVVVSSRLADPEVRAALAAAHRAHRLDADGYRDAKRDWERYRIALHTVELAPELARRAGDLAEQHALSGLDTIHLANAAMFTEVTLVLC